MALTQLRSILPSGDVGRLINSFIFYKHPDAEEFIRRFRQSLYDSKTLTCPVNIGEFWTYPDETFREWIFPFGFRNIEHTNGEVKLELCKECHCIRSLFMFHENALNMNLKLKHCTSWFAESEEDYGLDCGFTLDIDRCNC